MFRVCKFSIVILVALFSNYISAAYNNNRPNIEYSTLEENKYTPFHKVQVGFDLGLGDNSAPYTKFPFCSTIAGFVRCKNNMIGFRRDYHSELQIFHQANYYKLINGYYGFSIEKKNVTLTPQLGLGYFESNAFGKNIYESAAAELSVDFLLHIRGNGIGMRTFFLYNNKVNFVGLFIHLTLGWAY